MKKRSISKLLFILFTVCSFYSSAQQKSIGIGDTCPDILISHIINYKTSETSLGNFKGKLLVLDFWATWCTPCLSMLRVSDSLQKQFKDKIVILPVTNQDSATVARFLKKFMEYNQVTTPTVTGDKILQTLFPHTEIPHYVWIDGDGKVLAITNAQQLTASNIDKFLNGKIATLPVKADVDKLIDENKPFFAIGNEILNNGAVQFEKIDSASLLYHSIITKYIDGFGCEDGISPNKLECKNFSIGNLFRFAAGRGRLKNLVLNSTIWEVNNPAVQPLTDSADIEMEKQRRAIEWLKNYSYCYELHFPSSLNDKKFDIMLADINNYFGSLYNIVGKIETRKVICLALVKTNKKISLASQGGAEDYAFDPYHLKLVNNSWSVMIDILSINLDKMPPISDQTGLNGKIDIELNCNLGDLKSLNVELNRYGLQLQEKMSDIEMIVIKDKVL